jgi:glycine/D-amino acid oxidase-like deaminating enzyme
VNTDIAIIGAGAIGTAAAYELARAGASVQLIEREQQVGRGASWGTACLVTTSHAERLANPGALREAIRFLPDPAGPLAIRPRPRILPWLVRFAANAVRQADADDATRHLRRVCAQSTELHRSWARDLDTGLVERGILNVWTTPAGLEQRARWVEEHRAQGIDLEPLDPDQLRDAEPALRGGLGGLLYPQEAHLDSGVFCERLAAAAVRHTATVRTGVELFRIRPHHDHVELRTTAGTIRAEKLVVCAGVDARRFARDLRTPLPLEAAKGYHVEYAGVGERLTRPVFIAETRVVATPLEGRLRLAGTLEFGTDPQGVDQRRVDAVIRAGEAWIDGVAGAKPTSVWRGPRPVTSDGMPIIGRSAHNDRVVLALGHAMLGITMAPVTAAWLRSIIVDDQSPADTLPFAPTRFLL